MHIKVNADHCITSSSLYRIYKCTPGIPIHTPKYFWLKCPCVKWLYYPYINIYFNYVSNSCMFAWIKRTKQYLGLIFYHSFLSSKILSSFLSNEHFQVAPFAQNERTTWTHFALFAHKKRATQYTLHFAQFAHNERTLREKTKRDYRRYIIRV